MVRVKYGFRRVPHEWKQSFRFGFASGPRRFRAAYDGDFRGIVTGLGAHVQLRYSGIDNIRFHGFGNETALDQPASVYDVTLKQVNIAPSLVFHISPSAQLSFGPRFKYANTVLKAGTLLDTEQPLAETILKVKQSIWEAL